MRLHWVSFCVTAACTVSAHAQQAPVFQQQMSAIMARPEFAHARFGIEFYSVDQGSAIYRLNEQQLFVPGSTTKLLSEGTALELLGSDYRFHTRVYRMGTIKGDKLDGDIVLVASGDPDLSNRIQPDGTLIFEDEDHSYGGPDSKGLPGDRSVVLAELAKQIATKGIRKITGKVIVDASLFPEGQRELGTRVVLSPIVVNDNVVDVIVSPAPTEGAPATLEIAPPTAYVKINNQVITGKAGSQSRVRYTNDVTQPDGTHTVTLAGSIAAGERPSMVAYRVPEPSRYAAVLLQEKLREAGVEVKPGSVSDQPDFKALAVDYKPENVIAEHISPPLKEDVKITLKVSQNLHASMAPFLLGALLGKKADDVSQSGFDLEHEFLSKAGLDLTAAVQSDGAGGDAYFTPDFMVHYLQFMSQQKNFDDFYRGLPILGKDGTLFNIQVNSPAAGHVHAKTGTFSSYDALNRNMLVTGKGLAGYMDTKSGEHLILAIYINNVSVSREDPDAVKKIGDVVGEIASDAYECLSSKP